VSSLAVLLVRLALKCLLATACIAMWSSSRAWKDGSILPPDRWPATEITESDGTLRFVLKDGTEIHRIGILAEVYDYQTGWSDILGPRRRFVPLAADAGAPSKGGKVESLDY